MCGRLTQRYTWNEVHTFLNVWRLVRDLHRVRAGLHGATRRLVRDVAGRQNRCRGQPLTRTSSS